jgi:uncharacterized protein (TIGR00251 family)
MSATRVRVRVSPGATRSRVVGRYGDAWKVRVAAPPVDGRANDALVRLLADALAVSRESVRLVSGAGGRDKIVELTGIDRSNVERRLATASGKEGA